ncbi:uncharacterized protein LOC116428510 isoform X2 [Nomia melanderi]|uniref:uncharacterized protein LOC116428510 isoform X2 n=1 Tax=Nomia melanderi TaxID=2448451 RepID=UPI00130462E5|nr:uncharacterized protein LOC116428510 isoform X2 [Nomia melanderi]
MEEYTLEDAFEALKDTRMERMQEIEALVNKMSEMSPTSLTENIDIEEIKTKQYRMCTSLLEEVSQEEPRDYPIPGTSDLHVNVMKYLAEEVNNCKQLYESLKERLSTIQEDISYLENKKMGLEKMKQAYLDHTELTANTTFNVEQTISKRIFRDVKEDLELTRAYKKGGDKRYIDVNSEVLDFVNFLIEADIGMYHRNDRNKVKLMDML